MPHAARCLRYADAAAATPTRHDVDDVTPHDTRTPRLIHVVVTPRRRLPPPPSSRYLLSNATRSPPPSLRRRRHAPPRTRHHFIIYPCRRQPRLSPCHAHAEHYRRRHHYRHHYCSADAYTKIRCYRRTLAAATSAYLHGVARRDDYVCRSSLLPTHAISTTVATFIVIPAIFCKVRGR